uniref:Glycosyltransferase family 1 protein n=1 Tax=candidate division WOR-3 bacterium TaxID=2052148 RepID=A0A7V1EJ47_UNCW3
MNILIINWQDWKNPYAGGAEIYLYEIFSRLIKKGHKVLLLCSRGPGQKRYETLDGFEIIRVGKRVNFNFYVPFALSAILKNRKIDLIIDDQNKIPFYTPIFTKKKNLIMIMHLFRETIYRETNFLFASYVYITESLIPLLYPHSHFIAISQSTADDLKKMGIKQKISVVYSGIPELKNIYNIKREKNLVLYVGRIKRYKSIDHLLKAVNMIKNDIPVKLAIVGDGDALEELKNLARDLNLEVDFRGFVSEEEKYKMYQKARLIVQPSIKEGWGLTAIEAQACGTPVICANSPGLRETLIDGKTGYLYDYGNITELAKKIKDMLSDDTKWLEFSNSAIKWARNFSWDYSAEKMEKIIMEVYNA